MTRAKVERSTKRAGLLVLGLIGGCGARVVPNQDAGMSMASEDGASSSDGSATGAETGASEDGTEDDTETGPQSESETGAQSETGEPSATCGDGIVEGEEACDLGPANAWEGSPCQPDCTPNICGDGYLGPEERCDDGNRRAGDDCSADCRHPQVDCGGSPDPCGNTIDDDGDGLVDLDDPECLAACRDFSETYFTVDRPTQNNDKLRTDCWWDDNEGAGDDTCHHDYRCDPLSPAAPLYPYDPDIQWCDPQPQSCIDACIPLTPNGCDCNGCCMIDGEARFLGIWVQEYLTGCNHLDFASCHPCTIEESCFNPCEPESCELCFPDGVEALEPGCEAPACPPGVMACTDPYACADNEQCRGGCCLPAGIQ